MTKNKEIRLLKKKKSPRDDYGEYGAYMGLNKEFLKFTHLFEDFSYDDITPPKE